MKEGILMSNILVTAIGSFAADGVISNLKSENHVVIGCDIYDRRWIANTEDVDFFYQVSLAEKTAEYIRDILQICQKHDVEFVLPLTDIEVDVLNVYRDMFQREGVTICISPSESIKLCRNKLLTYQFLRESGISNLIPTYRLAEREKGLKLEYPLVVKPYDGRSSQGVSGIRDEEELNDFLKRNDISKLIVQPRIEGNIITIDVVRSADDGKQIAIARKELLRTLNGAGISVYVFKNEALEEEAMKIAELLNINGCVNFEYIETENGEYYFMECNPRFSGGVKFSCIAGYNCVINHLNCFTGKEIDNSDNIKEMYIARKYEEYITQM